jgi:hypothetical protein
MFCSAYLQDACTLADCQFMYIDKKSILCAFKRGGTCKKGDKCVWKH